MISWQRRTGTGRDRLWRCGFGLGLGLGLGLAVCLDLGLGLDLGLAQDLTLGHALGEQCSQPSTTWMHWSWLIITWTKAMTSWHRRTGRERGHR